jgi:hypothetical protein
MAHEHERDEWRSTVRDMSEVERARDCGHSYSRSGFCIHCGDDEPRLNLGDRG